MVVKVCYKAHIHYTCTDSPEKKTLDAAFLIIYVNQLSGVDVSSTCVINLHKCQEYQVS